MGGITGAVRTEGVEGDLGLARGGTSADGRQPGERGLGIVGGAAFFENALGEGTRGLDVLDVVEQRESLERRVAELAADAARFAGGRVEGDHRGRRCSALPERIQGAAVERFARVARIASGVAAGETDRFPDAIGLIRTHALAADTRTKESGDE